MTMPKCDDHYFLVMRTMHIVTMLMLECDDRDALVEIMLHIVVMHIVTILQ